MAVPKVVGAEGLVPFGSFPKISAIRFRTNVQYNLFGQDGTESSLNLSRVKAYELSFKS